jgi:hypothetical protein
MLHVYSILSNSWHGTVNLGHRTRQWGVALYQEEVSVHLVFDGYRPCHGKRWLASHVALLSWPWRLRLPLSHGYTTTPLPQLSIQTIKTKKDWILFEWGLKKKKGRRTRITHSLNLGTEMTHIHKSKDRSYTLHAKIQTKQSCRCLFEANEISWWGSLGPAPSCISWSIFFVSAISR